MAKLVKIYKALLDRHSKGRLLSKRHFIVSLIFFELLSTTINASEETFKINGFISQSYFYTNSNNYFYNGFDLSEITLNTWSKIPFSNLENINIAAQVYLRKDTLYLDYGFLNYEIGDRNQNFAIQLGKIKTPYGMFNEVRDVPIARPIPILPQTIYNDRIRSALIGYTGIKLKYSRIVNLEHIYGVDVALGLLNPTNELEATFLLQDCGGNISNDRLSKAIRLHYESLVHNIKLSASYLDTGFKFDGSNRCGYLKNGNTHMTPIVLSASYRIKDVTLIGEYMLNPFSREGYGPFYNDFDQTAMGYYLMGIWSVKPDLELFASFETSHADKTDVLGKRQSARTFGMLPNFIAYSRILSLGINLNLKNNVLISGVYQKHHGTMILDTIKNPILEQTNSKWDMIGVSVSFGF